MFLPTNKEIYQSGIERANELALKNSNDENVQSIIKVLNALRDFQDLLGSK